MIRDTYGRIEFNDSDIVKILYQNPEIDTKKLFLSKKDLEKYLNSCRICDVTPKFVSLPDLTIGIKDFDLENQKNWYIPKEYIDLDIKNWLFKQCKTDEELQRVTTELIEYEKFDLMILLKLSKFLVDTFRKNKIVWGVGRGSSVASYCLYLIGLHKINSLKYNLDIHEFLK